MNSDEISMLHLLLAGGFIFGLMGLVIGYALGSNMERKAARRAVEERETRPGQGTWPGRELAIDHLVRLYRDRGEFELSAAELLTALNLDGPKLPVLQSLCRLDAGYFCCELRGLFVFSVRATEEGAVYSAKRIPQDPIRFSQENEEAVP